MAEKAMFPMTYLRVTQGYNTSFSHKGTYALDLGGVDGGIDKIYAPFSGTVQRIRSNSNEMWITSDAPVEWADGTIDYMTLLFIHANSIPVANGDHFKQGEWIYNEGNKGNVTGIHVHMECAKGKFVAPYGYYDTGVKVTSGSTTYAVWKIYNQVKPHDALFLSESTIILDAGTDGTTGQAIPWKYAKETISTEPLPENTFFQPIASNLQFMNSCDVNDCVEIVPGAYLPMNHMYHALEQAHKDDFTWWKFRYTDGNTYWCAMVDGRYEAVQVDFDDSNVASFTVGDDPIPIYKSADLFDFYDTSLPGNSKRDVTGVSTIEINGVLWLRYSDMGSICYIPMIPNINLTIGPEAWIDLPPDTALIPQVGNCEYFNTPDVYDIAANQYLEKNKQYRALKTSTVPINNFMWVKIIYTDGEVYYVASEAEKIHFETYIYPTTEDSDEKYSTSVKGIDISRYQGTIDWDAVKADPQDIKFAFIRCVSSNNNGLYVDPQFVSYADGATRVGLDIGAYIYTYAYDTENANAEIDLAISQLQSYQLGYPIAWDCEDALLYQHLTRETLTNLAIYALGRIRDVGYHPIFYTYTNFANNYVDMDRIHNAGFDVWIADYRGYCGYTGDYKIWQYSSSGKVNGISGNVDMNISYWDYPKWIKKYGENNFPGGATKYPGTPMENYHLEIYSSNTQYFTYPSIYDNNAKYFPKGVKVKIIDLLNAWYDGFAFYSCLYEGKIVYVGYVDDGRMAVVHNEDGEFIIEYPHTICQDMIIESRTGHCEMFTKPDLNDPNRKYFGAYKTAKMYAILDGQYSDCNWVAGTIDGEIWYFVADDTNSRYEGQAYSRVSTEGSTEVLFEIISTETPTVAYKNLSDETSKISLSSGSIYIITDRLVFEYYGHPAYVILIDEIPYYAIKDDSARITSSFECPIRDNDLTKYAYAHSTDGPLKYYAAPSLTACVGSVPAGEKVKVKWYTQRSYETFDWYGVLINDKIYYVPITLKYALQYDFPLIPHDPGLFISPKDNTTPFVAYDIPSYYGMDFHLHRKDYRTYEKFVSDEDENGKTIAWHTIQHNGTCLFIPNDGNCHINYVYHLSPLSKFAYIMVNTDDYYVYPHITNNIELALHVPKGTLIPIDSLVNDESIDGIWYKGTWPSLNDAYCPINNNCDIRYIYPGLPVDDHFTLTILTQDVRAYHLADINCASFSYLPKDLTIHPNNYFYIDDGLWYEINFNNAKLYLLYDEDRMAPGLTYEFNPPNEGCQLKIDDGLPVYQYPNSQQKYIIDTSKMYTVRGISDSDIEGVIWVSIHVDHNDGSDISVYYAPLMDGYTISYVFPMTDCMHGTLMEVLIEDSFKYYESPASKTSKGILQKGVYIVKSRLDQPIEGITWYTISIDDELAYVPLISGQNRIYFAEREQLEKELRELDAILHEIRTDIDKINPENKALMIKVQKSLARVLTAEAHVAELELALNYYFA